MLEKDYRIAKRIIQGGNELNPVKLTINNGTYDCIGVWVLTTGQVCPIIINSFYPLIPINLEDETFGKPIIPMTATEVNCLMDFNTILGIIEDEKRNVNQAIEESSSINNQYKIVEYRLF